MHMSDEVMKKDRSSILPVGRSAPRTFQHLRPNVSQFRSIISDKMFEIARCTQNSHRNMLEEMSWHLTVMYLGHPECEK